MKTWKPTADQAREIRDYAKMRSGSGWVKLELGERHNIVNQDDDRSSGNYALFGDFENSDLYDFISWADFRKNGVELTTDGKAELDFYVHDRVELNCNINVTVMVDGKESIIICGE